MKPILITTIGAVALLSSLQADNKKDIPDTAIAAGQFNTLVAALKAADLVEALKGDGPFTVFAPTDEAFAKLPEGTVEALLKPENKDKLVDILTYHVVPAKVPFKTAVGLEEAVALNKKKIDVSVKSGGLFLNNAKVIENDIVTSNGVIHVIDTVLLPPADPQTSKAGSSQKLMQVAISKGVPLFNHGQHGACADIYEVTARAVMAMPDCDEQSRQVLGRALASSTRSHCATTRAWTMRRALDRVMASNH